MQIITDAVRLPGLRDMWTMSLHADLKYFCAIFQFFSSSSDYFFLLIFWFFFSMVAHNCHAKRINFTRQKLHAKRNNFTPKEIIIGNLKWFFCFSKRCVGVAHNKEIQKDHTKILIFIVHHFCICCWLSEMIERVLSFPPNSLSTIKLGDTRFFYKTLKFWLRLDVLIIPIFLSLRLPY